MQDFPANSRKAKQPPREPEPTERPKVERVTSNTAEQRKRGLGRKFRETFIGGTLRDTAEYMVSDIVVPAVQDLLYDSLEGGLRRMIHGETNRPRPRGPAAPTGYSSVGHVNYQGYHKPPPAAAAAQPSQRMLSRRSRGRQDFGEIVIEDRREAQDVIEQMFEVLSKFGVVYVADLYEMTGIQSSHVDYKWGWKTLQGAKARRLNDGRFLLDIPEPQPLE
jgi:hypothetical protein